MPAKIMEIVIKKEQLIMKICVTSEGNDLDSKVDQRFGRAKYFIFYDDETALFETISNKNVDGTGGVGVQSAQLVAEKQAKTVLTGKVGPNASKALESAGIDVVLDVEGSVKEALTSFLNGKINSRKGPNAKEKSGLNN